MRNPWTGINCWRELLFDARHPGQLVRRSWDGARGRNPQIDGLTRFVGIGLMVEGAAMFLLGLCVVVGGL